MGPATEGPMSLVDFVEYMHSFPPISLGPRGIYLALAAIQCFIVVSIAPESPDSKSVGCQAGSL